MKKQLRMVRRAASDEQAKQSSLVGEVPVSVGVKRPLRVRVTLRHFYYHSCCLDMGNLVF
jgi:hypothetical protein